MESKSFAASNKTKIRKKTPHISPQVHNIYLKFRVNCYFLIESTYEICYDLHYEPDNWHCDAPFYSNIVKLTNYYCDVTIVKQHSIGQDSKNEVTN